MKQTKAAGAARERQVRELFRSRGYVVFKSSDSAVADVIALRMFTRPGIWFSTGTTDAIIPRIAEGYVIEVKANADGGPYKHFPPADRAALSAVARQAGAQALLVHWPPRGERREIPETEWPTQQQEVAA